MATDITSAAKHPTARRRDPACGTCRKKCRKCDRKRPICDRCRSKGLHCEGYPPRFQFCEMVTAPDPQSSVGLRRNSITISPRPLPLATILGGSPAQDPPLSPPAGSDTPAIISITDSASPQVTLPPSETQPDSNVANISSSPSSAHCQLSALYVDSDSVLAGPTDLHREILANRQLIDYFDRILSEHLTIHVEGTANPFREHVLPLAHQHQGVLHALLGLSACHMHLSGKHESQNLITISLRYRVLALHSLGSLLSKEEEISGLTISEGEYVLGMVLLLVLHDVCETGVSSHGAHLTGVSFLCHRLACPTGSSTRSKASMFFIAALAWLDMLRGFSGAEKLAYSEDVRRCVRDHGSLSLHTLVGCPPVLFHRIGQVLEAGKSFLAGNLSLEQFQARLDDAEKFFRSWDPDQAVYPTGHQGWRALAEAYRHACLLRALRFPDAFAISCEDVRIKVSVSAIFDICANMPRDHEFYKRLLFPLFLAGVDTSSPHQLHYASWCIGEIKHSTGFQHPAMTELLTNVWEERRRATATSRGPNVPWMEFTCSELLRSQHAYLFF